MKVSEELVVTYIILQVEGSNVFMSESLFCLYLVHEDARAELHGSDTFCRKTSSYKIIISNDKCCLNTRSNMRSLYK